MYVFIFIAVHGALSLPDVADVHELLGKFMSDLNLLSEVKISFKLLVVELLSTSDLSMSLSNDRR